MSSAPPAGKASGRGGPLPEEFGAAAEALWRALESPTLTGWMTLPCGGYVDVEIVEPGADGHTA